MGWLRGIFSRRRTFAELSEEMRSHLEERVAELVSDGMERREAEYRARREFGNFSLNEREGRDVWRWSVIERAWTDVKFGFRILRKNPGFAAVAILTLALGIGACSAIFSVVYGALLAPLPMPHPEELVMVWSNDDGRNVVSPGDFWDWRRQNSVFQNLVAWDEWTFNLSVDGRPQATQARVMTPGFFEMQGIPFSLGRDFLTEEGEPGKEHVVILTNRLWRERFGSDPSILGRQVRMDGTPYTVVGVLAAGMPDRYESHLFVPMALRPDQITHERHWMVVMGRLKPGVTIAQANADMDRVARNVAQAYPKSNKGWGVIVEPLKNAFTSRDTIKDLWLLMAAVGFVLLIACVNVANLLLARGTVRRKEAALRASLGATRGQLFSQFLSESLALAAIGGALGIGLAAALLKLVVVLLPQFSVPTEADIRLNLPVLLFSVAATILAGVLCGCAPALQVSRWSLSDTLKEGGRSGSGGRNRLRRALVVAEFALALTLLAGAGLVIHSFWKLTRADLGFRRDHILTFTLPVSFDRFPHEEQITAFYRPLLERISALPGIVSATFSSSTPIDWTGMGMAFSIAGQPPVDPTAQPGSGFNLITPDYFRTYGMQITQGRGFTDQDFAGSLPVAMVNETFVKKFLAGVDPLTQRVVVRRPEQALMGPPVEWQIVGVYRDVRNRSVRREIAPEIDVPFWQDPLIFFKVSVRTNGDPAAMTNSVAAVLRSMDPDMAMDQVRTMDQVVDESLGGDRFVTYLFAGFAGVALVLAAIGIYGVMSFAVAQRTQEIGLRMALGADARHVLGMVLQEGMTLAGLGLVIGLSGTFFVGRTMKSILYEISAIDPVAVGIVALVLMIAALLACYLPARRATRVDAMVALRYE
ncbi:MAG TPA: ABC transporter permease [Candidatus Sulfotelmatobacter sp.]|nr:ABC transporter permease [Candidatus Sulfotelmatobacter sp.]